MKSPEYVNVTTINDAVSLLSKYPGEAKVITGGVDLIGLMKNGLIAPKILVNIKAISDLAYITEDPAGLRIGALATINNIETSSIINDKYCLLAEAARSVASPQIRNVSTLSGNLCQSVRCWYYRRLQVGPPFFCRMKGGKQCYAVSRDNRYSAIIGDGQCYAVCPSDLAVALLALQAKIRIISPTGERVAPIEDFYSPLPFGNILRAGELITEIRVPTPTAGARQRYSKFRLRETIDFAISSVAMLIDMDDVVTSGRIVLGGVAPVPYRAFQAEKAIEGRVIEESLAREAAKAALIEAKPLRNNSYIVSVAEDMVKKALLSFLQN